MKNHKKFATVLSTLALSFTLFGHSALAARPWVDNLGVLHADRCEVKIIGMFDLDHSSIIGGRNRTLKRKLNAIGYKKVTFFSRARTPILELFNNDLILNVTMNTQGLTADLNVINGDQDIYVGERNRTTTDSGNFDMRDAVFGISFDTLASTDSNLVPMYTPFGAVPMVGRSAIRRAVRDLPPCEENQQ